MPPSFLNLNGVVCSNTLFSNNSALTSSLLFRGNSTCRILEHLIWSNTSGFQFLGASCSNKLFVGTVRPSHTLHLADKSAKTFCKINREAPIRFGSVTVWEGNGSSASGFRFWRFLCKKGFSVFQYSLTGKNGSGFGSWKRFRRYRFRFRFREEHSSNGSGFRFRFVRVARLQSEFCTKDFFRATNFLTKNAPKFSPKFLSLCSVGQKKSHKIPAKFPTKFPCAKSKKKFTDELLQERRENGFRFLSHPESNVSGSNFVIISARIAQPGRPPESEQHRSKGVLKSLGCQGLEKTPKENLHKDPEGLSHTN